MPPFFQTYVGLKFLLPASPALKCNFGSKLVEVRGYSLFCDEKRIPSITPKRKGRSSRRVYSRFFSWKIVDFPNPR